MATQPSGEGNDYVLGRIEEWKGYRGIITAGVFGTTWIFVQGHDLIPDFQHKESPRVREREPVAFKWVWRGRRMIATECWRLKLASPKGWSGLPLPEPTLRMTRASRGKLFLQYVHAGKPTGTEAGSLDSLNFKRALIPAGSDLSHAQITWTDLREAKLDNVNLSGANLFATDLTRASLTGATASHANLRNAGLREVDLKGMADLTGATIDALTYQKSGWLPRDLVALLEAGVAIHALNEFPTAAQEALSANGPGLTLTFDTRLHRFDPTAFDVLIASVLGPGTDVTVEQRSNIHAEGPGFIRIRGSRPQDLIAVAEVFYERAWRNTAEFVEQRAVEKAMSSGMSLILRRLDEMRGHVINMRASTDLLLPEIEARYKAVADAIESELRLRHSPPDSAAFVARLEADVDASIRELESQRHHLHHALGGNAHHEHEKSLRSRILTFLRGRQYNVSAETDEGGFTDLLVRSDELGLLWIAECKIYRETRGLEEGLLQLHTRYASGRYPAVALVILCFQRNAAAVLRKWHDYLADKRPCGMISVPAEISPDNLCFVTKHIHQASGNEISTRHVIASLYWNPQDRSGRKSH